MLGNFNRVPVAPKEFFEVNDRIKARYEAALANNSRLVVFLDGVSGTGKYDMLWRLDKQGYSTCSLPFVQFALNTTQNDVDQVEKTLSHVRNLWNVRLREMIDSVLQNDGEKGRKGLLFVPRALRRKERENLDHVVIALTSDPIQIARRVAEKTYYDSESKEAQLYIRLQARESKLKNRKHDAKVDSTSAKQGITALLKTIGVPPPDFSALRNRH